MTQGLEMDVDGGVAADIGVCNVKMSPERSGRQQDPIHPTAKGGKAPEP